MDKNYLTVAEYAAIVGITPQAVYKQLNNKLKPFVIEVDGKKALIKEILQQQEQPIKPTFQQQFTNVDKLVDTLNMTIELLNNQLSQKDEQINQLNQRLQQALNNTSQSNFIAVQAQQQQQVKEKPKLLGFFSRWRKEKL